MEAKIDDEEVECCHMSTVSVFIHVCCLQEFKAQCFGGDYTGEVYDHVLKKSVVVLVDVVLIYVSPPPRTHYRRQKRWWSAYLLFYDRADQCPIFDGEWFSFPHLHHLPPHRGSASPNSRP